MRTSFRHFRERLTACPADCGDVVPAPRYRDRSFALGDVSPDQARIAAALPAFLGPASRVLHVGIGGSALAAAFAGKVAAIDGITVVDAEIGAARALGIAAYRVFRVNKYGPALATMRGAYDAIVDNNPGTYACCVRHFRAMMAGYSALLAPGGVVVTEARGAGWRQRGGIALDWAAWAREGDAVGLVAERHAESVWLLRRVG